MATKVASLVAELTIKDNLTPGLKKADRALGKTGKEAEEAGKKVDGMGKKFAGAAKHALAFVPAFVGVLKVATDLAKVGLSAERSKLALEKLSGSAQEAERWIKAIETATLGTVTQGEAAAQAYQLMRFGLADSAEAAQKFVHDISIVAKVNPQIQDTSEAINQIQLTLSNMSFMRLDQLGISAGVVRARMAELKEESSGLTKEEAFQIAVMEEITEQADILGDEILELGSDMDWLDAQWGNFKEGLGARIAEGFSGWAFAVREVTEAMGELSTTQALKNLGVDEGVAEFIGNIGSGPPDRGGPQNNISPEEVAANLANMPAGLGGPQGMPVTSVPGMNIPTSVTRPNEVLDRTFAAVTRIETRFGLGGDTRGQDEETNENTNALTRMTDALTSSTPLTAGLASLRSTLGVGQGRTSAPGKGRQGQGDFDVMTALGDLLASQGGGVKQAAGDQNLRGAAAAAPGPTLAGAAPPPLSPFDIIGATPRTFDSERAMFTTILDVMKEIKAAKPINLAEKFGLGADQFDTDVFREMQNALSGIEIEGTAAADAMQLYQLQTGMATGSSELFNVEMENLAAQLEAGTLGADAYVTAVTELGQTDLSFADDMIARMVGDGASIAEVNAMVDKLATMDISGFDLGAVDSAADKAKDFFSGGFSTDVEGDKLDSLRGVKDNVSVLVGAMTPIQTMMGEVGVLADGFGRSFDRSAESAGLVKKELIRTDEELIKINDNLVFTTENMALMMDPALVDAIKLEKKFAGMAAAPVNVEVIMDIKTNPATMSALADLMVDVFEARGEPIGVDA